MRKQITQIKKWATDFNTHVTKEYIWPSTKRVERCSTSLVVRDCRRKSQWDAASHSKLTLYVNDGISNSNYGTSTTLIAAASLVWLWLISVQLAQNWGQRGQERTAWRTSRHFPSPVPQFLSVLPCLAQNSEQLPEVTCTESRLLFWDHFLAPTKWWSQSFLRSDKPT